MEATRRDRLPLYNGSTDNDDAAIGDGAAGLEVGHIRTASPAASRCPAGRSRPRACGACRARQAIAAGEAAAKLLPRDAPTRYRVGRLLRRVPGKLRAAIDHFNGCLMANDSYPGLREAQLEAVAKMKLLQHPPRGQWMDVLANLLPVVILLLAMSHFLLR